MNLVEQIIALAQRIAAEFVSVREALTSKADLEDGKLRQDQLPVSDDLANLEDEFRREKAKRRLGMKI